MKQSTNSQRFKLKGADAAVIFRANGRTEVCLPQQAADDKVGDPTLRAAVTVVLFDGTPEHREMIRHLVQVLESGNQSQE